MSLSNNARALWAPGGRHGLSSRETREPIGLAVAGLNRLAQTDLLDRLGLRQHTEDAVFRVTRGLSSAQLK